jgi:hypothetical protein
MEATSLKVHKEVQHNGRHRKHRCSTRHSKAKIHELDQMLRERISIAVILHKSIIHSKVQIKNMQRKDKSS